MTEHGAERRDAGSTGDEKERALGRLVGEGEAAERPVDPDLLAAPQRLEVRDPAADRSIPLDE